MDAFLKTLQTLPEAAELVSRVENGGCPAVLTGTQPVQRACIGAAVADGAGRPMVFLCADEREARQLAGDLQSLTGQIPVTLLAREWQFRPIAISSREWERSRLAALHQMAAGGAPVVVATVDALLTRTMPPERLAALSVRLETGGRADLKELTAQLLQAGYTRCDQVEGVGQFALRGGILDVFSPLMEQPVRCEFFDDESIDEEPSKFEKWLEAKFGSEKLNRMILGLSTVIGIALPVGLFLLLPSFLGGFVPKDWGVLARNVLEGIVRIAIFLMFMWSVSHMKDIRRTFEYHGAEHKTIFCYEAGEELTVENVRKQGRFHPRCGTSFMFVLIIIATIVSSIVFSIIDITNPFLRMLAHLILLPLVVGISYEFNRYAGRSESVISRALRWPGLMI